MYSKIFQHQLWHFLAIVIALWSFYLLSVFDKEVVNGSLFEISTMTWLWIAVWTPIVHQIYVFLVWRYQLYTNIFTKKFGVQKAFKSYAVGFSILFVFRLISLILLAYSNKDTLHIDPLYAYTIAAIITPFVIYLFYSVKRYFTIERAYGIDHFDKAYDVPYVKQGIFKYTDNGMYVVGLAILYLPGLLLFSEAAIFVALFNHLYIWVHYYTTERPDMEYIYGSTP